MDVVEVEVTVWYCGGGGGAESQHSLSGNSLAAPRSNRASEVTSRKRNRAKGFPIPALLALAFAPAPRHLERESPGNAIELVVAPRVVGRR